MKDKVVNQVVLGQGCCKLIVQGLLWEAGLFEAELLKVVLCKVVLLKLPLICGKILLKLFLCKLVCKVLWKELLQADVGKILF